MEGLVLLLALLVFGLPIAGIVAAVVSLRRQRQLRAELQTLTEEKTRQIQSLWRELKELRAKTESLASGSASQQAVAANEASAAGAPKPVAAAPTPPLVQPPAEVKPVPAVPQDKPAAPTAGSPPAASSKSPVEPTPPKPTGPPMPPRETRQPAILTQAPPSAASPTAARISPAGAYSPLRIPESRPSLQQRIKKVSAMEETLGTNWLNRLGIIILVIGLAFFGAYEVHNMGPMVRVVTLYGVAFGLLGLGIFFERRETYRVLGYAGIGGGWALLFFCAYAMHHLDAMRVLYSEPADLAAMLAVAIGMALHTLRYRSQFVTGLGFLLGYATIAISHDTVYSLSAGVILAIGLVTIVLKMSWFELEIFGILSGYLNHLYWLYRLLGPEGANGRNFAEYRASMAMLLFFWLTFRISYIVRKIHSPSEERVSTVAALMNTLLLLGIMKFQSVQPELAYVALLAIGGLEFAFAQLPITRRRREAFVILTVLGTALMLTAVPMHWDSDVALLWVVGAEAFLISGIVVKEVLFRRLGLLTGVLIGGRLIAFDFRHLLEHRVASEAVALTLGITFAVCAVAFYLNFLGIGKRNRELFDASPDRPLLVLHGYLGAFSMGAAAWALVGRNWQLGPAFLVAGIVLALLGRKWESVHLVVQENLFAAAAVGATLMYNFSLTTSYGPLRLQVVTVALVAAGLYAVSRVSVPKEGKAGFPAEYLHTLAATGLLTYLLWYEVSSAWLAAAWAIFALALTAIDRRYELNDLRWQAHGLALLAMTRALAINLTSNEHWHGLSVRLLSLSIVAVVFYAMSRLIRMPEDLREREFHHIYSWSASVLTSLVIWYEVQPLGVAVGWGIFGLVLYEYAFLRGIRQLRLQANVAFLASFIRIFFVNLTAGEAGQIWGPRVYTVLPLALIYFFVYSQEGQIERPNVTRKDDLFAWLGSATIAAFLYFHVYADWVATAFAVFVFALLGVALLLHRKVFLYQGLLLSLGVVARGTLHNLFGTSYFQNGDWEGRFLVLGSAVAVLLSALPLAFRLRSKFRPAAEGAGPRGKLVLAASRPEQFLFFSSFVLLTLMLMLKMNAGMITVSWGVEGVAVILFGLAVKERSFRLAGLILLLVCVGKIVALDVWGLQARDRYITLIVVGAALVTVSFLYSKYRDAVRQLL
jgi:hypothetical protein